MEQTHRFLKTVLLHPAWTKKTPASDGGERRTDEGRGEEEEETETEAIR